MTKDISRPQPLTNIRVLDLGGEIGAYATKLLADLGADVLKVEPSGGDRQRRRPPFLGGDGLVFAYYNANKRGVTLDLDADDAAARLAALAAECDVVVIAPSRNNPVPGWDWDGRRPEWVPEDAILCRLTPYGVGGPRSRHRSTHFVSFAASGLMWPIGPAEGPPRALPGQAAYDEFGGHAAALVMSALREREPGAGRTIDLALHDLLAYRSTTPFAVFARTGREFATRAAVPDPAPAGVWRLADGLMEIAVYQPPQWNGFLDLLGRPAELTDPALSNRGVRAERGALITSVVGPILATWTTEDFVRAAHKAKVPCAPLREPAQIVDDRQLAERGYWTRYALGDGREAVMPGTGLRFTEALVRPGVRPPPRLADPGTTATPADPWPGPRTALPRATPGLAGLKVISFGTAIAGNVSAMMLAELGADVVKVESPRLPDPLRNGPLTAHIPRVFEPGGAETNARFAGYTRSCRSVALDMTDPADRERFLDLVAEADVLLDNFAFGVMEKWGIERDGLRRRHPSLVVVTVSGYGRTGEWAPYRAYGSNINAYMGLTRAWFAHGTQCDWTAVSHVLPAVVAALLDRDRTGRGCLVDLAQTEAAGAVLAPLYLAALNGAEEPGADVAGVSLVPGSHLATTVPAAGTDEWLAVDLEDADDWNTAAELLDRPDLRLGHRLGHHLGRRLGHRLGRDGPSAAERAALRDALADWAGRRGAPDAADALRLAGLAAAPVARVRELFEDAQLWARGGVTRTVHPDLGETLFPAPFHRMDRAGASVRWSSPRLGEHTDEVMREWLGRAVRTDAVGRDDEAARG
ncbi:CoA transferase [Streptosporangium sp. NPDC051022]|uniref:CaiB/BaiF CoA-transferase family protein n=1 Tax=Streptosporangium sp. NPDC051022 TaxID=3155752 RepID=UPI00341C6845